MNSHEPRADRQQQRKRSRSRSHRRVAREPSRSRSGNRKRSKSKSRGKRARSRSKSRSRLKKKSKSKSRTPRRSRKSIFGKDENESFSSMPLGVQPPEAKQFFGPDDVPIPTELVGRLLGIGGANIRRIQQHLGGLVQIRLLAP